MRKFLRKWTTGFDDFLASQLYDQDTFYKAFVHDLKNCTSELIIESPFITTKRVNLLLPIIDNLAKRGVNIVVNTRNPHEHDGIYQAQAEAAVAELQALDVSVLYTVGHHRKLAIIDRTTTWEGSLNILSHNDSCEIMRRTLSVPFAQQLMSFIKIEKYLIR